MRKLFRPLFLTALLLVALYSANAQPLKLWDNKPAKTWMTDAYPIGNGRMGGMVFGGVGQEHIQFNEMSLWTGDEDDTGAYQAFGDVYIKFDGADTTATGYRRELDLNNSLHRINYTRSGVKYNREYFCSFPDRVMVLHYMAGKKGAYSATIQLTDAHNGELSAAESQLQITGSLNNGLQYSSKLQVKNTGGTVTVESDGKGGQQLRIKNADSFTILLAAAINYSSKRELKWRDGDAAAKVNGILIEAAKKTNAQLLAAHQSDYKALFGTVNINLGAANKQANEVTTGQRIINYKKERDSGLETLLFQYGRYLLISSSRKGGLPANLQGLWNNSNNPPWRSDYHSNINIQMNYWPAEPAGLSECHWPYLDYINSMREVKSISTRKEFPNTRGWTVRTENNIFGGSSFLWNTPGSAWYAQALWEHYAFTKDKNYLRNFAYPIIKEIVEFWDDHLKRRPDGTLVSPLGWSPEHGPTEDGVSFDQQIVYDLFTNYTEAAAILNVDAAYRTRVADMREHLLKPKIGSWGQLQEWETDRDDPKDTHRHASHLFALHPGRQISVTQTPELAKAAKVSLEARGDESTGWSMAWKVSFWARLRDGEHAYRIINNFITLVGGDGVDYNKGGGIYANLLCAHPPFQIDGNLGYTAAVCEMLLQSHAGELHLLPATPAAWNTGNVQGLRARGNFTISNMEWKDGKVTRLVIKSLSGGSCTLRSPNKLTAKALGIKGQVSGNTVVHTFNTQAGKTYTFTAAN